MGQTPPAVRTVITDLRLGFQNTIKNGYWSPVAVDVESKGQPFKGVLELSVPDGDGLSTSILREVYVPLDERLTVYHYLKPGNATVTATARLIGPDRRVVDERTLALDDLNVKLQVLDPKVGFSVYHGTPSGLFEAVNNPSVVDTEKHQAARILILGELPTQWFAYGGVREFLLTTSSSEFFAGLDPLRADALTTWVRQGGHLVISASSNWQIVQQSFVGPMLPATLVGVDRLRAPETLESYASAQGEGVRMDLR
ncbi:MAG: hypothetical protein ACRDD1_01160, partial [Planctomycetia bacterium]